MKNKGSYFLAGALAGALHQFALSYISKTFLSRGFFLEAITDPIALPCRYLAQYTSFFMAFFVSHIVLGGLLFYVYGISKYKDMFWRLLIPFWIMACSLQLVYYSTTLVDNPFLTAEDFNRFKF